MSLFNGGNGIALILVLFILLVIIAAED